MVSGRLANELIKNMYTLLLKRWNKQKKNRYHEGGTVAFYVHSAASQRTV